MSLRTQWTLLFVIFALAMALIPGAFLELRVRDHVEQERAEWEQRRDDALAMLLENSGLQLLSDARRLAEDPELAAQLASASADPKSRRTEELAGEFARRSASAMVLLLRADGRVLSSSLYPEAFDRRHPRAGQLLESMRHAPFVWAAWASGGEPPYLGAHERMRLPDGETIHLFAGRALDENFWSEQARLSDWKSLSLRRGDGEHALPVGWALPELWHLQGDRGEAPVLESWMRLRRAMLTAMAILLLVALIAAPIVAARALRPMRELIAMTSDVARGEAPRAGSAHAPAEIQGVANALVAMEEELRAAESRMRSAQRRAAWRGIADRIAHEIKNALSPLALALDNLETLRGRDDERGRQLQATSIQSAREQLQSLDRLLNEFRSFSRLPEAQIAGLDAPSLASSAIDAAKSARGDRGFHHPSGPTLPDLQGDAELLRRALLNLLLNAADAMDEAAADGEVELLYGDGPGDRHWWIAVRDRGVGLGEGFAERMGEPYFTTKEHGTGLGLAIVLQIAESHGGRLLARTREGGGSEFRLELPRTAEVPREEWN
jgi:signal transduction histidine kinase